MWKMCVHLQTEHLRCIIQNSSDYKRKKINSHCLKGETALIVSHNLKVKNRLAPSTLDAATQRCPQDSCFALGLCFHL